MDKYNLKSIVVALIILIIGILLVAADATAIKSESNVWISIGCSLIASGLVILLNDLLVDKVKDNPLKGWGIEKIYKTRSEKNAESDPELDKAKYRLDAVAFGLKSFRNNHTDKVKKLLENGVNIRIITMNPESQFIAQREKEENEKEGQIQNTIHQLVDWADKLNENEYSGKIIIKGYSCMTLDFYWRVDDTLYIGPYWYGMDSQQTITYKFSEKGKAFKQYTDYFEQLWKNASLCETLTEVKEFTSKGKRRSQHRK